MNNNDRLMRLEEVLCEIGLKKNTFLFYDKGI